MTVAAFEQVAYFGCDASDAQPNAAAREIGGPPFEGTDTGEPQFVRVRKIDDDAVTFRTHIDGSSHVLSPEHSMKIQAQLGSDNARVLD